MYTSKFNRIFESDVFLEAKCHKCGQKPAVRLMADCDGDGETFCKTHWEEWFKYQIIDAFDEKEPFVKTDDKKYDHLREFGEIFCIEKPK